MEIILGLLAIIFTRVAYEWFVELWNEWSGCYGRWRMGQPLRASEQNAIEWKAQEKAHQEHRQKIRAKYDQNPYVILDKQFRNQFIALQLHRDVRHEVIARDGFTCACCKRAIKRRSTLHVDHINPRSLYPHLEFVLTNLQVMCSKCNRHKYDYDGSDWQDVVATRRKSHAKKVSAARRKKMSTE